MIMVSLNLSLLTVSALILQTNVRHWLNASRKTFKVEYDFIVIDTPAVSHYADAVQIATLAQRVLVVSRSGNTTLQSLKEMLRRLTVTESRVLGAVINRF